MPGNHRSLSFSTSNLMYLVSRQKAFVMSLSVIEGSVLDTIFEVTFLSVCPKVGRAIPITFAVFMADLEPFRDGLGEGFVHQMMDKELPLLSMLGEADSMVSVARWKCIHQAHRFGVQDTTTVADAVVRVSYDGTPFFTFLGLIPRELRREGFVSPASSSIFCVAFMSAQFEVGGVVVRRLVIFMTDDFVVRDWAGEGFVHEAVDVEPTLGSSMTQLHKVMPTIVEALLKLVPTLPISDTTNVTNLVPREANNRFPGFSFHGEDQSTTWALAA